MYALHRSNHNTVLKLGDSFSLGHSLFQKINIFSYLFLNFITQHVGPQV